MGYNHLNHHKASFIQGILALFLIVMWLNFFPFYGPGYYALGKTESLAPHLFTAAHILALIAGSWFFTRMPVNSTLNTFTKLFPAGLAILTMVSSVPVIVTSRELFIIIFFLQGLLSGILVSRWMVWFCSEATVFQRGSIFGKIIGVTFIALSFVIIVSTAKGFFIGYLVSALAVMLGGVF